MLAGFRKNYHLDRNYTALYLHSFFKQMTISVIFAFTAIFRSAIHRHIRRADKNMILFGTSWQIALCMGEAATLPVMALIAYIAQDHALPVLMSICGAGVFIAYGGLRKIDPERTPDQ